MTEATETETAKARRLGRSPAYPSFPVQKALEQVKALYDQEKEYAAPFASALKAWGYGAKSSGGRQSLATIKYYGLIDITGEGDSRRIKVSDIALKILRDPREDETEKRQLIRRVALTPAAHKLLLDEYPNGLASDGSVQYFLQESGFNGSAAKELLEEFKQTASFVGLYDPSFYVDKPEEKSDTGDDKTPPVIKVGDKVQVTVAGVDMFSEGATVLGFSDDNAWVFTDQSDTAASIKEVTLLEAATHTPEVERPTVPAHLVKSKEDAAPKGTRKAVFPLDDGDVALIFPEGLSSEGLEELGAYLDIFLKKEIKKSGAKSN